MSVFCSYTQEISKNAPEMALIRLSPCSGLAQRGNISALHEDLERRAHNSGH